MAEDVAMSGPYNYLGISEEAQDFLTHVERSNPYLWYHNLVVFTNRSGEEAVLFRSIANMVHAAVHWCSMSDRSGIYAAHGACLRAISRIFCLEYDAALASARAALSVKRAEKNVLVLAAWLEVVALARGGKLEEAQALFPKMWRGAVAAGARSLPPFPQLWDESVFPIVEAEQLGASWKIIRNESGVFV